MRLDAILDSFYIVSSLWGATGPRVCSANSSPAALASEVISLPISKATAAITAFVDVNVVPMDSERVLLNQTVLVDGGRITALGPVSQVKVPAGAVRVDGRGKYLMPGLVDMHRGPVHSLNAPPEGQQKALADQMFLRYVAHGVTGLRSLRGSSSSELQQLQRFFAEFPVPRMYLAVENLPRIQWSNPDSVAAYIAKVKAAGYTHIVGNLKADSVTMAALGRGGLPMVTHSHGLPFPEVLKLGASGGSAEHLYVFWDSLLGMPGPSGQTIDYINGQRPRVDLPMAKVPALVAALQRAGVWVTPTLRCTESTHPYINDNGPAKLVKAMQDGGVKMLLGGDGWSLSRWSTHGELVALVKAGLTPYQALLTGTRNPAEYFHLLDSAGTVAVGKRADLVLLNGDPLKDIRKTWEPAGVMLNGQWFDRVVLDQRQIVSPRLWFEELLGFHMPDPNFPTMREFLSYLVSPPRTKEQWDELERRGKRVYTLADSLDHTNRQINARVLPLISAELGGIRTVLTPEQHPAFDANVRVWIRDQARQGNTVAVPGVSPTPP